MLSLHLATHINSHQLCNCRPFHTGPIQTQHTDCGLDFQIQPTDWIFTLNFGVCSLETASPDGTAFASQLPYCPARPRPSSPDLSCAMSHGTISSSDFQHLLRIEILFIQDPHWHSTTRFSVTLQLKTPPITNTLKQPLPNSTYRLLAELHIQTQTPWKFSSPWVPHQNKCNGTVIRNSTYTIRDHPLKTSAPTTAAFAAQLPQCYRRPHPSSQDLPLALSHGILLQHLLTQLRHPLRL